SSSNVTDGGADELPWTRCDVWRADLMAIDSLKREPPNRRACTPLVLRSRGPASAHSSRVMPQDSSDLMVFDRMSRIHGSRGTARTLSMNLTVRMFCDHRSCNPPSTGRTTPVM